MRTDKQGRRLCSAHTTKGAECRAPAVTGSKVCRFHGAAKGTPGREAADRLVLGELVGPALLTLQDLLDDPETPPAVRLHTAREVLTRTGYGYNERPPELQIVAWLEELIVEQKAGMTPEELAQSDARHAAGEAATAEYDRSQREAARKAAREAAG